MVIQSMCRAPGVAAGRGEERPGGAGEPVPEQLHGAGRAAEGGARPLAGHLPHQHRPAARAHGPARPGARVAGAPLLSHSHDTSWSYSH